MSLFIATNKYGLQMALFLPALLLCDDFRLDAELRWGPRREPRRFHLESNDGLTSHYADSGTYVPAELHAFLDRFRQVAPAWEVSESTEVVELGREGVWVPDYRFVHKATGTDVLVEVLGFWKRSSLDRLLRLLPKHGPPRHVLAISDRLKVDDEALDDLPGPVLRFKEIPNAPELAALLEGFLPGRTGPARARGIAGGRAGELLSKIGRVCSRTDQPCRRRNPSSTSRLRCRGPSPPREEGRPGPPGPWLKPP